MKKIRTLTRDVTRHIVHVTHPIIANGDVQMPGSLLEVDRDVAINLYSRGKAVAATEDQITSGNVIVTASRETVA